jgi:Flp pilus assembly protein TadD
MRDALAAEIEIKKAASEQPDHPDVMTAEARLLVQTGEVEQSLRRYGEIIKRYPNHMPAWHYNGMAHMMSGDPAQAVKSWEHIQKADPGYFAANDLGRRVEVARRMQAGR